MNIITTILNDYLSFYIIYSNLHALLTCCVLLLDGLCHGDGTLVLVGGKVYVDPEFLKSSLQQGLRKLWFHLAGHNIDPVLQQLKKEDSRLCFSYWLIVHLRHYPIRISCKSWFPVANFLLHPPVMGLANLGSKCLCQFIHLILGNLSHLRKSKWRYSLWLEKHVTLAA